MIAEAERVLSKNVDVCDRTDFQRPIEVVVLGNVLDWARERRASQVQCESRNGSTLRVIAYA